MTEDSLLKFGYLGLVFLLGGLLKMYLEFKEEFYLNKEKLVKYLCSYYYKDWANYFIYELERGNVDIKRKYHSHSMGGGSYTYYFIIGNDHIEIEGYEMEKLK
jgi:hypothetical protein